MSAAGLGWAQVLRTLLDGRDLSEEQSRWAMEQILAGHASQAQIAGFAVALRAKGESAGEVQALAATMLDRAELVTGLGQVLDVVGTGGDHSGSVNISTMAALVAAACGVPVVKHGNRAASSQAGTADVLEALGVAIGLSPSQVAACVQKVGIGFAFAPVHHPAMKHAAQARRDLGVPTVFNILGPLTNPARAQAALIGCADARLAPVIAEVLARRGVSAIVVRGTDGLDEISTAAATQAWDVTGGSVRPEVIEVAELGVVAAGADDLAGGDPARNASLLRMTLGLADVPEPDRHRVAAIRDAVAVNAAAALVAWAAIDEPPAGPLAARIAGYLPQAQEALLTGSAGELLQRWTALSSELATG